MHSVVKCSLLQGIMQIKRKALNQLQKQRLSVSVKTNPPTKPKFST